MAAKSTKQKGSWRCPKCGREFAQRSAYHGCGQYTVEGYLEGKNPQAVALFKRLVEMTQGFDGVTLSPAKTQISFRVRSNFLMVAVAGRQISGYLFLPRAVPGPWIKKIVASSSRRHAHQFRINDPATLEGEFKELLGEAIAMVSDPPEPTNALERQPAKIGEEINAIYRAERRA